ncbi:uncharacterized protein Gasu_43780 [Galdieria sulphuraria]|uniref:Uncharacterized protein n=1 Tax=Galdieria sulphuraria TaxID=130081 RepID=M2XDH7_GALSU|nr:uncharacterized protein Gasu_43780 [Galdieria sulphuraria]EME28037.1 hypothetical protein Gasu_43780 [Galdieria sulphuraria]|eukprot:XP_005704557.1 hypothetical protein Gasu_43780 [Galdieria sulphuraria]
MRVIRNTDLILNKGFQTDWKDSQVKIEQLTHKTQLVFLNRRKRCSKEIARSSFLVVSCGRSFVDMLFLFTALYPGMSLELSKPLLVYVDNVVLQTHELINDL